jgi:hypothetical protein
MGLENKPIFVDTIMMGQMFPSSLMKVILFFVILAIFNIAGAQPDDILHRTRYTPEFKFKEGVYLGFDQVRQNNPIPKSRIITSVPYDDPDFYESVLKDKKIQLFDNLGVKQEIQAKNIWGFSRNGVLYISLNEGYFRVTIIGNICHFVASQTSYNRDRYYPYSGYGYPNAYSPYYNPYYSPYSTTNSNVEMRQYLLDFKTGNVLDYNEEGIELLLMTDPELHDEFASLSKKKQKQLKFLYIRKFNERNPLYFPEN